MQYNRILCILINTIQFMKFTNYLKICHKNYFVLQRQNEFIIAFISYLCIWKIYNSLSKALTF